ncbi:Tn3 family transposase [Shinella zoogloeoides]|uniref:Tn3 family transposase n=1 Tax=Shinella zoogloeoides TaxID=352475 RepID=UPI0039A78295
MALRDLGRINRSIFLPQSVAEPRNAQERDGRPQRRRSQNTLARALFFNRLGELRDRTFERQFYRASGLNLLINAIVYWNTLSRTGVRRAQPRGHSHALDIIKHITPLGWQ